jgi:hypothetical protein
VTIAAATKAPIATNPLHPIHHAKPKATSGTMAGSRNWFAGSRPEIDSSPARPPTISPARPCSPRRNDPWQTLTLTPAAGRNAGVEAAANRRDTPKCDSSISPPMHDLPLAAEPVSSTRLALPKDRRGDRSATKGRRGDRPAGPRVEGQPRHHPPCLRFREPKRMAAAGLGLSRAHVPLGCWELHARPFLMALRRTLVIWCSFCHSPCLSLLLPSSSTQNRVDFPIRRS